MLWGRGLLLAIEGIDGAGKTTQIRSLELLLSAAQIPFVSTKEPTSGPWGAKIRESAKVGRMSPEDELHAFLEDRRDHVANLLRPMLQAGRVVLVDRYYLSTVAYQGARGMNPTQLLKLNSFAPSPDILIVLDVPPRVGLQRIHERGDAADLFEKEDELARARDIFKNLALPNQHTLDATRDPASVTSQIAALLFGRLGVPVPTLSSDLFRQDLRRCVSLYGGATAPIDLFNVFDEILRAPESSRGTNVTETCRLLAEAIKRTFESDRYEKLLSEACDLYLTQFLYTCSIDPTFATKVKDGIRLYL